MTTWINALLGNVWRSVALVVGVQLAVLTYMVWTRVTLVNTGREISVDVVPVDPRDLFRGDYVILGYPFSTTMTPPVAAGSDPNVQDADVALPEGSYRNAAVYVTLAQPNGATSSWDRVRIDANYPAEVAQNHIVVKGYVDQVWKGTDGKSLQGRIRYGIEKYFVPEGEGREIEKQVREKKVRAVLAVGADGTAAIKALEVDGKRIHEQPVL